MGGKRSRTFYFYSIIKYSAMDIIGDGVIPVEDRICDDFMKSDRWIADFFKSGITQFGNMTNNFLCLCYGAMYKVVSAPFDGNWIANHRFACSFPIGRGISFNF